MKLISKNSISRFSNQDYSMQSMLEYIGRVPHVISGYIKSQTHYKNTLIGIIEGLGNVYGLDSATKIQGIDTYSFTWKVDVSQIPTPRFTRDCTSLGNFGAEVTIYLDSPYYATTDVLRLENDQQLYVLTDPERINNDEYAYQVRLVTDNPNDAIDIRFTTVNRSTMYAYNANTEWSVKGSTKVKSNFETHINYMAKIRVDQSYSSDFKATEDKYFISEEDSKKAERVNGGSYKIVEFPKVEQNIVNAFIEATNGYMIWGKNTMNPNTGRSFLQLPASQQDVMIGSGLIQLTEQYAFTIDYTPGNLSVRHFQVAMNHMIERVGKSVGNHFTVLCTRKYFNDVAEALKSDLFNTNPYGMWFYTKDPVPAKDSITGKPSNKMKYYGVLPNEIAVGASFSTYIYQGNTVNFIVEEYLSRDKRNKGYALFLNTGMFVDENDKPAPVLSMYTIKGREAVTFKFPGIGGMNGTTSGVVSSLVDGSTIGMVGWRGIAYRAPYGTVIMQELA